MIAIVLELSRAFAIDSPASFLRGNHVISPDLALGLAHRRDLGTRLGENSNNKPSESNGHTTHPHGLAKTCTHAESLLLIPRQPWTQFRPCEDSSEWHSQAKGSHTRSLTQQFTPEANPKVALNPRPIYIHMGAVAGFLLFFLSSHAASLCYPHLRTHC